MTMSEVKKPAVERIRNRLYTSVFGRALSYAGIATGATMMAGERGVWNGTVSSGLAVVGGSAVASMVERRLAYRQCEDIMDEERERGYVSYTPGHEVVKRGQSYQRTAYGINGLLAPYLSFYTAMPNPEGLSDATERSFVLVGAIGAMGIVGGIAMDVLGAQQAIHGYELELQALRPAEQVALVQ